MSTLRSSQVVPPTEEVRLNIPTTTPNDVNDVIISQLSSPYEISYKPDSVIFTHPKSQRDRFLSAKSAIAELRSDIQGLKRKEREWERRERERERREIERERKERERERRERERERRGREREEILIEWEIRTRIAQALNDMHVHDIPESVLSRLKDARFGFLPTSLSSWASFKKEIHFQAIDNLSDDDYHTLWMKGSNIYNRGLANDMEVVWNAIGAAIPSDVRSLIITMWVLRSESRKITHPIPTASQAEKLIENDPYLTLQEITLAKKVIYTSPLFM